MSLGVIHLCLKFQSKTSALLQSQIEAIVPLTVDVGFHFLPRRLFGKAAAIPCTLCVGFDGFPWLIVENLRKHIDEGVELDRRRMNRIKHGPAPH